MRWRHIVPITVMHRKESKIYLKSKALVTDVLKDQQQPPFLPLFSPPSWTALLGRLDFFDTKSKVSFKLLIFLFVFSVFSVLGPFLGSFQE